MRITAIAFILGLLSASCNIEEGTLKEDFISPAKYVIVLGIAQDAGYPQAGCQKSCCVRGWTDPSLREMVSSIAIIDTLTQGYWIIDATPDFKDQLRLVTDRLGADYSLKGIFLTHAHIGHYTGLMHLGHEVMGAKEMPVYVMPRMHDFLKDNGPWSQLVDLDNIALVSIKADSAINITSDIAVVPKLVPHRDEYSETVGYSINSSDRSLLFIPDIDKWSKWNLDIIAEVKNHNYALLDATFFGDGELPNRDMSKIPHPFVAETMSLFNEESSSVKSSIHFIHLNHTNPLLDLDSKEYSEVISFGANVCSTGEVYSL